MPGFSYELVRTCLPKPGISYFQVFSRMCVSSFSYLMVRRAVGCYRRIFRDSDLGSGLGGLACLLQGPDYFYHPILVPSHFCRVTLHEYRVCHP